MATLQQAYYSKRGPLPDNSDPDVAPPAAQAPGSRRQCLDKIPNVSMFPLHVCSLKVPRRFLRDGKGVQIRSRSLVAPADLPRPTMAAPLQQLPRWFEQVSRSFRGARARLNTTRRFGR